MALPPAIWEGRHTLLSPRGKEGGWGQARGWERGWGCRGGEAREPGASVTAAAPPFPASSAPGPAPLPRPEVPGRRLPVGPGLLRGTVTAASSAGAPAGLPRGPSPLLRGRGRWERLADPPRAGAGDAGGEGRQLHAMSVRLAGRERDGGDAGKGARSAGVWAEGQGGHSPARWVPAAKV